MNQVKTLLPHAAQTREPASPPKQTLRTKMERTGLPNMSEHSKMYIVFRWIRLKDGPPFNQRHHRHSFTYIRSGDIGGLVDRIQLAGEV